MMSMEMTIENGASSDAESPVKAGRSDGKGWWCAPVNGVCLGEVSPATVAWKAGKKNSRGAKNAGSWNPVNLTQAKRVHRPPTPRSMTAETPVFCTWAAFKASGTVNRQAIGRQHAVLRRQMRSVQEPIAFAVCPD